MLAAEGLKAPVAFQRLLRFLLHHKDTVVLLKMRQAKRQRFVGIFLEILRYRGIYSLLVPDGNDPIGKPARTRFAVTAQCR